MRNTSVNKNSHMSLCSLVRRLKQTQHHLDIRATQWTSEMLLFNLLHITKTEALVPQGTSANRVSLFAKDIAQQLWLVLRSRHHQKSGSAIALPQQRVVRCSRVVSLSRSYRSPEPFFEARKDMTSRFRLCLRLVSCVHWVS